MKNENQIKEDLNGRLHSLDQTVRSVEKRLRAVERRLSVDVPREDFIPEYETDFEEALEHTREEIASIRSDIDEIKQGNLQNLDCETRLQGLDSELAVLKSHITELREENSKLSEQLEKEKNQDSESITLEIKNEITQLSMRLEKAENHNRINIGSMKVPVELSGVVGALILTLTGILIMQGRWDIIRSAYFSFSIAFVFAIAVLLKFYMANSKSA
ncbi:hypothetical protein [Methanolobus psychrotolerans]|uniref:hypothetical protein n=1 Tax=Methanolobus psychrotolerans TaxID=1874706 RepID=UPI000B91C928|nr:hypothetical protein [Methanolobus psychrotolerans]